MLRSIHRLLPLSGTAALILAPGFLGCSAAGPEGSRPIPAAAKVFSDGRPGAPLRMEARDEGIVLRYGGGPDNCDVLGARDIWVWEDGGTYFLHYDGAGEKGWLACLATSKDLVHWETHGPALDFGEPGSPDARSASYGVTYDDGDRWHIFYLGTPNVTPGPDFVPMFPYLTMKAEGPSARGPWSKRYDVVPFRPQPDTYYSSTASPGHVIETDEGWVMFFSASTHDGTITERTLGIARTEDLDGPWSVDPDPIVPLAEQIENSSLYFEPANDTWFLFTNHIGVDERGEYTDAVWVYWSKDLNSWSTEQRAVVLDGANCTWSKDCIGLPGVVKRGDRLAILYDAPGEHSVSHMKRHVGLAWLDLPLRPPAGD
jgi:predicted GH43/DUF377 family glycosyl hydrolase